MTSSRSNLIERMTAFRVHGPLIPVDVQVARTEALRSPGVSFLVTVSGIADNDIIDALELLVGHPDPQTAKAPSTLPVGRCAFTLTASRDW